MKINWKGTGKGLLDFHTLGMSAMVRNQRNQQKLAEDQMKSQERMIKEQQLIEKKRKSTAESDINRRKALSSYGGRSMLMTPQMPIGG